MASFNPAPSAFPRQAVVASATLPPQAPAPSFFGGNTADANPSAPVVDPAPPADTFTATAPAPVATTAAEATDAKKAEAAKTENGFVKFAKSPWGIGTGVLLAGSAVTALVLKIRQGGSPLEKLEKVVKDLGIDDLDPEHKNNLLQQFAEHLQGLTANTTEHTPETWDKLSSAIVDVHAKHGGHGDGQIALLHGLGGTMPDDLTSLSSNARQAIHATSESFVEGLGNETIKAEEGTGYAQILQNALKWLVHPHGDESFGIKDEAGLVKTSANIVKALGKVDPKQEHLYPILHNSLSAFTLSNKDFPVAKKGDTLPEVDLTKITDVISAGTQLHNARLKGPKETEEVLAHLNAQGIDEGYGALSKPDGFKDLETRLLPKPEPTAKDRAFNALKRFWAWSSQPWGKHKNETP
ncbi:MAG: hypothetical protein ACK551_05195 [Vampirovibrionales bacterium]